MPEQELVRLGEYEQVDLPSDRLTNNDLDRLRLLKRRRAVVLTATPKGWRIKAGGTVGLLVLDRIRLLIEPKFVITGSLLIRWLAYACDVPPPQEDVTKDWTTGADGYPGLVARALLDAADELLRHGLRQNYRRQQQVQPVLRGRLDVVAQVTCHYGQLDKLQTVTFDRDIDIWENRVLHTALLAASHMVTDSTLARSLTTTASAFPADPAPITAPSTLYRATYNRLNERYRTSHGWARLLLCGGGVTDLFSNEGLRAKTLLLDMPDLWENVTRRLIGHVAVAHGSSVLPTVSGNSITTTGDIGKTKTYRPDVLVRLGEAAWLPIDAKYKTYDGRGVASEDVHQLLTYIVGYGPRSRPRAVIVHPRHGDHTGRALTVTGPHGLLGIIHVVGIDTRVQPADAADWLSSRWPEFVS